ncbi:serine/threonine protein phosphatase [Leptospira yasudae]|uniref:Serine/threonine protein phosphatase n=1 Tax=Leptospira yasudae TaxID=2202201 RepID=A0ABX9M1Z4_9LEPT|nr:SpoIIE family protein phosphatase [Leptospira yasudae]RHX79420.1 serine/threonine protein phosphatase [Leptospira yasudae]RHX95784.1 serine/threonine protein phosphatase [Leptospira yasudae]TGK29592.1 response regulator [Leptospira yasudae]TGM07782.1 response regulator [Leptospira yasudae]
MSTATNYSLYTVLAVDDSEINLKLIVHTLKPLGFQIFTAESAADARNVLLTNRVDILLLDVSMPGQDGFSFCKELREIERFKLLPILFITAINRELGFDEAISHGGDDFIHKPFQPRELIAKIRAFIRIKILQDEVLEQKRNYEKELIMARKVQQELLPEKELEWSGVSLSTIFQPLMQIGGDYTDAWIENDCLHIFIADCSGHGPSAALLAAMLKMQVSSLSPDQTLQEKVRTLRHNLEKILPEEFSITFFYGILHKDLHFEYSNGGHPSPMLFKDGVVTTLPGMGPLIIPIEINVSEEFKTVQLEKGSYLLLYTDGATEIADKTMNILGEEKLKRIFQDGVSKGGDILASMMQSILAHSDRGTNDDDIAMMVLKL